MFEYGWDITGSNPSNAILVRPLHSRYPIVDAGVDWLKSRNNFNYSGKLYISRMHVRYNRETFRRTSLSRKPPIGELSGQVCFKISGQVHYRTLQLRGCSDLPKGPSKRRIEEVKSLEELTDWPAMGYQIILENLTITYRLGYLEPLPEKEDKGEFILLSYELV
ncbi:hypothetical protein D5R40_32405 [Okeania hirsuta]|uniref:Uncharacterized protein n=1 Tax=Okeania hirsuta TaxID=1458930 RepID=A0A3N6PU83_9CYAN|nr:hypothetical protein [Okeania hirsuta]RQH19763.1 hypothetical protein D5R40_32405 [Okeania hirsuta]